MHESPEHIPTSKVNNIVRPQEGHGYPHVQDNEDNYACHLIPLHRQVLRREHGRGAHMTRKIEVIRIEVGHR